MQRFALPLIEVPVSDRRFADTLFKQKAVAGRLVIDFLPDGSCRVELPLIVTMYAADASAPDGFGPALTATGFSTRPVSIATDNDTLVNAQGQILAIRHQGRTATDEQWQARLAEAADTDMLQGEFFAYLAAHQPVRLLDMVYAYIQQADAAGKFA